MSQSELVALAYAVVFVFVLGYVVIIAAKLARLERETADLLERAVADREGALEAPRRAEVLTDA